MFDDYCSGGVRVAGNIIGLNLRNRNSLRTKDEIFLQNFLTNKLIINQKANISAAEISENFPQMCHTWSQATAAAYQFYVSTVLFYLSAYNLSSRLLVLGRICLLAPQTPSPALVGWTGRRRLLRLEGPWRVRPRGSQLHAL